MHTLPVVPSRASLSQSSDNTTHAFHLKSRPYDMPSALQPSALPHFPNAPRESTRNPNGANDIYVVSANHTVWFNFATASFSHATLSWCHSSCTHIQSKTLTITNRSYQPWLFASAIQYRHFSIYIQHHQPWPHCSRWTCASYTTCCCRWRRILGPFGCP